MPVSRFRNPDVRFVLSIGSGVLVYTSGMVDFTTDSMLALLSQGHTRARAETSTSQNPYTSLWQPHASVTGLLLALSAAPVLLPLLLPAAAAAPLLVLDLRPANLKAFRLLPAIKSSSPPADQGSGHGTCVLMV